MPTTRYSKAKNGLEILTLENGDFQILAGGDDLLIDGCPANIGSLYLHTNGNHYKKTGPNDTDWEVNGTTSSEPGGTLPGVEIDCGTFAEDTADINCGSFV